MLTLYHHGSSVCAAKVRLALFEKKVDFDPVYIDVLAGDQFAPDYLKLNPKALVPTLVHDGAVLVESTAICEYIEDSFPGPTLRPADTVEAHRMRLWTKSIDEELHLACAALTFAACHRHIVNRLPPAEREAYLDSSPTAGWREKRRRLVEQGFAAPEAAAAVRLHDRYLGRMEEQLARTEWLAGDSYSLADIGMTTYVNRLAMLSMERWWTETRPNVTRWFHAVRDRPSFQAAVYDWCPAELVEDQRVFGAKSWPEVAETLRAAAVEREARRTARAAA